jgi:hypothetical protein
MYLQKQAYPTLAFSKIIENSLIMDFLNRSDEKNVNLEEKILSKVLYESIEKYLVNKTSNAQKKVSLVI